MSAFAGFAVASDSDSPDEVPAPKEQPIQPKPEAKKNKRKKAKKPTKQEKQSNTLTEQDKKL